MEGETVNTVGPARSTQMPLRRVRVGGGSAQNAGYRLARETVSSRDTVTQQATVDSFPVSTLPSATQRPKFSQLAHSEPESSSPTSRIVGIHLPDHVDNVDQQPSQDPIECSDDENGDGDGGDGLMNIEQMLSRSTAVSLTGGGPRAASGLSKTRGQKVSLRESSKGWDHVMTIFFGRPTETSRSDRHDSADEPRRNDVSSGFARFHSRRVCETSDQEEPSGIWQES
jgi:hypothetical protein